MTIQQKLRVLRKEAKLSQGQLGQKIGYTGSRVSDYETGQRQIGYTLIERWSEACGFEITFTKK